MLLTSPVNRLVQSLTIIDVHTHLGRCKSGAKGLIGWVESSPEDLLGYMDSCSISRSVVLPIQKVPNIGEDLWMTEKVLEGCKSEPSRLIPFCVVSPETEDIKGRIKGYVEEGCRGFGEHRVPIQVDHPANIEIYSSCENLGIPILIEISDSYNFGFDSFAKVASDFKGLIFIAHGPGWWREISADADRSKAYPTGPIIPGGQVERILLDNENVYADISAYSGYNALSRDIEFSKSFVEKVGDKLVFGTDFPCIDLNGVQFGPGRSHLSLLEKLNVSSDSLGNILSGNISSILGL